MKTEPDVHTLALTIQVVQKLCNESYKLGRKEGFSVGWAEAEASGKRIGAAVERKAWRELPSFDYEDELFDSWNEQRIGESRG